MLFRLDTKKEVNNVIIYDDFNYISPYFQSLLKHIYGLKQ